MCLVCPKHRGQNSGFVIRVRFFIRVSLSFKLKLLYKMDYSPSSVVLWEEAWQFTGKLFATQA